MRKIFAWYALLFLTSFMLASFGFLKMLIVFLIAVIAFWIIVKPTAHHVYFGAILAICVYMLTGPVLEQFYLYRL